MALFFDSAWFDTRLAAAGLTRGDVATALGLSTSEIAELWKDQRELKASDVRILAGLIGAPTGEVASRAGVSTPTPRQMPDDLAVIAARLERIEAALSEIKAVVLSLKAPT